MKAAIVLDSWKLEIFKKTLDEKGYSYTQHKGLDDESVILQVETDSIESLAPVVREMNAKAARSRLN